MGPMGPGGMPHAGMMGANPMNMPHPGHAGPPGPGPMPGMSLQVRFNHSPPICEQNFDQTFPFVATTAAHDASPSPANAHATNAGELIQTRYFVYSFQFIANQFIEIVFVRENVSCFFLLYSSISRSISIVRSVWSLLCLFVAHALCLFVCHFTFEYLFAFYFDSPKFAYATKI